MKYYENGLVGHIFLGKIMKKCLVVQIFFWKDNEEMFGSSHIFGEDNEEMLVVHIFRSLFSCQV